MLLNQLDRLASEKIVGLKNNYDRAMMALEQYYNNCSKLIAACMKEVKAPQKIRPGDYDALVSYKKCIVKQSN